MKKFMAFFVAIVILSISLFSAVSVSAVTRKEATFTFNFYKYSKVNEKMEKVSECNPGDKIYVGISVSNIEGIGGFAIKLGYDPSDISYDNSGLKNLIFDEKSELVSSALSNSSMILTWDTHATNTNLSGLLVYIPFTVNNGYADSKPVTFTASIDEAFEGNAAQTTINTTVENNLSISVVSATVPQDFIDLVETLRTIIYNPNKVEGKGVDSLANIEAALEQYKTLNGQQQNTFARNYKDLYDILTNAKNQYYNLASTEATKLAKEEADAFLGKFGTLLAKNAEDLTLDADETALKDLKTEYPLVSTAAKNYMGDAMKDKCTAFISKYNSLLKDKARQEEIQESINDFLSQNDIILSVVSDANYEQNKAFWQNLYNSDYGGLLASAISWYDTLFGNEEKAMFKKEYDRFMELAKLSGEYEKIDALTAKLDAFRSVYREAFNLDKDNVALSDKAILDITIRAFDALTDEEMIPLLQPQVDKMRELLKVIDELEEIDEELEDEEEDFEDDSDDEESVTETITETVTKWANKLYKVNGGFRLPMIILIIMLILAVGCQVAAAFISQKVAEKNNNKLLERMREHEII